MNNRTMLKEVFVTSEELWRSRRVLFATLETRGNWTKLTFTKTSTTVNRNMEKNQPIADRRVSSNDPSNKNYCETHFG